MGDTVNKTTILWVAFLSAFLTANVASAWRLDINFDGGVIGEQAERSPNAFAGAGGRSVYTNEQKLKGQAVKLQAKAGETGFGNWGGELFYPKTYKGETIWYLIHTYIPQEFIIPMAKVIGLSFLGSTPYRTQERISVTTIFFLI